MARQDPRRDPSPDSVNEVLLDRMIRHLLYLVGLQTSEANWAGEQFDKQYFPRVKDEVYKAIGRLKEASTGAGVLSVQQQSMLSQLSQEVTAIGASFMVGFQEKFFSRLKRIAMNELDFEHRLVQQTIPIEYNFKIPSESQLESYLKTQPMDGKPLKEWFDDIDTATSARINKEIRIGLINGESNDAIARRIRGTRAQNYKDGILNTTRRHALSIARSATIFANDQASQAFYRQNEELYKGEMWILTLDTRTCPTCMAAEADSPYDLGKGPQAPVHPNCRCLKVAIVKSWRELGIDLDEAPASTRASMDGQVPESMTYNQWLRKQANAGRREVVEDALGKTKAKIFIDGELSVTAFTNRRGNVLTIEQLRRKEADVFEALGL
ncbi:MAG: hypothetical protein CL666_08720 [Balneola sp.]|nr:hypothetical protein [Balneola sp.]|tara:strand:+ start:11248 stop:12393 length:1146 start_codon:yes stop_codon:yes gene_type:complete